MSLLQLFFGLGLFIWGCGIVYMVCRNRPKWPPTWRQDWEEEDDE